jgi:hypothetical protein
MPYITTLTSSDLEFGKRLADALQEEHFPFTAVYWLYSESSDDWSLSVVSKLVDDLGPRETYLRLADVTKKIEASDFQLLRISAVSPGDKLYQALRAVFGPAKSVEGARLHNTMVNGVFVEDAYLYKVV